MDKYDVGLANGIVAANLLITYLQTMEMLGYSQEDLDAFYDGFNDGFDQACSESGLFEAEDNITDLDKEEDYQNAAFNRDFLGEN